MKQILELDETDIRKAIAAHLNLTDNAVVNLKVTAAFQDGPHFSPATVTASVMISDSSATKR